MKPRTLIPFGFVALIALGGFLLTLPMSNPSGEWRSVSDALFTACSAVCITGLTVIEPGRDLTLFGQGVLLTLVQIGCVGIMTLGTFFLVCVGRRLSLSSEFSLSNAYGTPGVRGIKGLVVWVVFSMLLLEAAGTYLLHLRMGDWYRAYFYAVMALCNAGFSLDAGSLAAFRGDPAVLCTMSVLTILGGVGFLVLYNLVTIQWWRRSLAKQGRLSLHTRVVLVSTGVFLLVTFLAFFILEWNGSLASCSSWSEKLSVALLQSVTPRTCGFTVVPISGLHPATRFFDEVLMFVGAAPGGAGGGIKITTFVVFLSTLLAIARGRKDTEIGHRTVPENVVRQAIVIVFVMAAVGTLAMTALLVTEAGGPLTFEHLMFETVSAVSTTGLSIGGVTQALSGPGRVVLMVTMFIGRLGALAIVMLLSGSDAAIPSLRYPKEELVVG